MSRLEDTLKAIRKIEIDPDGAVGRRLDALAVPDDSLGRLAEFSRLLGTVCPRLLKKTKRFKPPAKTLMVFAADHGVTAQNISPYPPEMTRKVLRAGLSGRLAANVMAVHAGAKTVFVDCGVLQPLSGEGLISSRVAAGTRDFTEAPAMTRVEAIRAVEAGIEAVEGLKGALDLIGLGTLGVGNTTTAAALVCALAGRPPNEVVGVGSGADREMIERKADAVRRAIRLHDPDPDDALGLISKMGGFEIAAVCGACLAAARRRKVVLLDDFASTVGGLLAVALAPDALGVMVPSHLMPEPGHAVCIRLLDRQPLLVMNVRLGSGVGACMAMSWMDAAARLLATMATKKEAGLA